MPVTCDGPESRRYFVLRALQWIHGNQQVAALAFGEGRATRSRTPCRATPSSSAPLQHQSTAEGYSGSQFPYCRRIRYRCRFRPRHRWKQQIKRTAHGGPSTPGGLVQWTIPGTLNPQRCAPSRHRAPDGASHMRRSRVPSLLCASRPGGTRFVASVHNGDHEGPWPSRWGPLIRLLARENRCRCRYRYRRTDNEAIPHSGKVPRSAALRRVLRR